MPFAMTLNAGILGIKGSLVTAGTGVNLLTVDINEAGSTILSADGEVLRISREIAEQFRSGDRLISSSRGGLLLIPEVVSNSVKNMVDKSAQAFDELATASDEQIVSFFCKALRV